MDPFITIVHQEIGCKLLLINNHCYYSELRSHKQLRYFKEPSFIEVEGDDIMLHSKNGKQLLRMVLQR